MAAMTPEQIAEAKRLLDASTADIPGDASDEEIDRRVHERTVAERTFMADMAPALLADIERLTRGGKELGKVIDFLAELIKNAYLRSADDPIGAAQMLGNCLAEVLESEGGLSPAEFNRVQRALDARKSEEETRLRDADERRRAEVSRSLADIAHAQRPLTEHERAFQDGV